MSDSESREFDSIAAVEWRCLLELIQNLFFTKLVYYLSYGLREATPEQLVAGTIIVAYAVGMDVRPTIPKQAEMPTACIRQQGGPASVIELPQLAQPRPSQITVDLPS
ncbi:hypothetical protein RRF57_011768 [Xylaria bambusicola]|uniref:Uncharacterized protein n=1 Tax=Xylaria bambusicola TaxID=326684 RepID=A0AAN7UZX5_9PEZI